MARHPPLRIHDILTTIREHYGRDYAENTRETVRRQVIHQFEQAGIVIRNPDEPNLPTNSPRTHYALSYAVVELLRTYQTVDWEPMVENFLQQQGALLERYRQQRHHHRIPLTYQGQDYYLSPGKHNLLQAAIVKDFGPRFAPAATIIYLGDTERKRLLLDEAAFTELQIDLPSHDKLPDIVLYDTHRHLLFFD